MRDLLLIIWLPLVGCTPDFDFSNQWKATDLVCGWESVDVQSSKLWSDRLDCAEPAYPSEACVDAVLSDFQVDVEAFLEVSDEPDPYRLAREECPQKSAPPLNSLLWGARLLFTLNLGQVADLRPNDLISQSYLDTLQEVARESGVSSVNAALYNLATSVIEETRPDDPGVDYPARFHVGPRTLLMNQTPSRAGIADLETLIHEPRHAWRYNHLDCRNPYLGESCDETPDGTYGFVISTYYQLFINSPEIWNENSYELEDRLSKNLVHVFTYLDEQGRLQDEWQVLHLENL
jgi:hypothetical protein